MQERVHTIRARGDGFWPMPEPDTTAADVHTYESGLYCVALKIFKMENILFWSFGRIRLRERDASSDETAVSCNVIIFVQ